MGGVQTMKLDWVNRGRPFEVTAAQFGPEDHKRGVIAKAHVLKEMTTGLNDVPPDVREELVKDARSAAQIAQINSIIHSFLCRIDPAVEKVSVEEMQKRLTIDDYKAFQSALQGSKNAGEGRPLAEPSASARPSSS